MDSVIRKIDKLGRIVLPADYRKALNMNENTQLALSIVKGSIIINLAETTCKLCGSTNIILEKGIGVCNACIKKIKQL